jgi:hypothetical protein
MPSPGVRLPAQVAQGSQVATMIAEPLRLTMTNHLARSNRLAGAWWPYSGDLTVELPPLLEVVARRIGRIRGVLLNRTEWASTPLDWFPADSPRTRISWYGHQDADEAILIGDNDKRVDLLVIPASADEAGAATAMSLAARPGNGRSGTETLQFTGCAQAVPLPQVEFIQ